jgi:hypothetical protein
MVTRPREAGKRDRAPQVKTTQLLNSRCVSARAIGAFSSKEAVLRSPFDSTNLVSTHRKTLETMFPINVVPRHTVKFPNHIVECKALGYGSVFRQSLARPLSLERFWPLLRAVVDGENHDAFFLDATSDDKGGVRNHQLTSARDPGRSP